MKPLSSALVLLLCLAIAQVCPAADPPPLPPPTLTTPAFENVRAGMATLVLQSDATGTGYFTLLHGSGAACGTGEQVKAGQDSSGVRAPYHGSLPLVADTPGRYTVRNLMESTPYTLCFTAGSPGGLNLNPAPATATLTTTAVLTLANRDWNVVGSAGFSAGPVSYTSLAFAPDRTPYVAYRDEGNGGRATVMRYHGGWQVVGSPAFSAGQADCTSLAIAPDGTLHVAYTDWANGWKATVMKFNGSDWVAVGSVGFSVDPAYSTSLAFAPDGAPYVAYSNGAKGSKASVMKFNGTSWEQVGGIVFSTGTAYSISLAFAPDGTPWVAYQDGNKSGKATVMRYDGISWVFAGSAGFSGGPVDNTPLVIDPDGTPYVAYMDGGNGGKATVMKFNGSDWVAVGSPGFSAGQVFYPSLAIAPDGTPYVAYMDMANSNKATVMRYDGSDWMAVVGAGFSAGEIGSTSLAIDPDGSPSVAYADYDNSGNATMMDLKTDTTTTLSSNVNPSATGESVTFTATMSPAAATGTVTFMDGGTHLGSASLSGGVATYGTASFTVGDHTITAVYSGDSTYDGSTSAPFTQTVYDPMLLPTLTIPVFENVGAGMATLVLQSGGTGIGYFTLLHGNGAACGTGVQVKAGQDSSGVIAPYHGSLALLADTPGRYTIRNLAQGSAYTVCFTAYYPSSQNLNPYPAVATLTTTAVLTLANPSWGVVGSDGFSASQADYTSLAIAPDGSPSVAYSDWANSGKVTVMKFNGTSWANVGGAGFSAGQVSSTSMAFGPDGTLYVAYSDVANGYKATVMRYDGSGWVAVGGAGFSAGMIGPPSLAIDPDGSPSVAYSDWANNGKVTVKKFNGTSWANVGGAGFSAGQVYSPSLAFAPDGSPYVAYIDWVSGIRATVMRYDGSGWEAVGGTGVSTGQADYTSLAFAPDGIPYVAYRDLAKSGGATVMALKSATITLVSSNVNPSATGELVTFTATVSPAAATGTVTFMDGGINRGSASLSGGVATYSTATFTSGDHTITAVYSGDSIYHGSMSAPLTQAVLNSVSVSVTSAPAGLNITVDGYAAIAPQTFSWVPGSSHTIATTSPQVAGAGSRYVFGSWSDGGALSHDVLPSGPTTYTAAFSSQYTLATTITGNGTVTSGGGIACSGSPQTGTCSAWYEASTGVTLTAAVSNSVFSGWGGACAPCGGNVSCPVTIDVPKSCGAAFVDPSSLVLISGSSQTFSSLNLAYAAAGNSAIIKAQAATFDENLLIDVAGRKVTLRGGYGPAFVTQSGYTTVRGTLTIGKGALVADRLVIR